MTASLSRRAEAYVPPIAPSVAPRRARPGLRAFNARVRTRLTHTAARLLLVPGRLCHVYFRVECHGIEATK